MNFSGTRNSTSANSLNPTSGGDEGVQGRMSALSLGGSGNVGARSLKYVYDLPYFERKELCRILDENNQWEALGGGLMCYPVSELSEFGKSVFRGGSPTDALLTAWGSQNHTILELFTLLGRLNHFRGMKVIQNLVDQKYHMFIKDQDINVTAELIQLQTSPQGEAKPQNVPEKLVLGEEDKNKNFIPDKLSNDDGSVAASIGHLPQIAYDELLRATDNWERRNILGKGGFGTVYRGIWKNTPVAIKRMEQRANQAFIQSQLRQSLGELRFLNSYRHDNILPLYGFCLEGEHPCLVYQYMSNGSLEDRLLCRQKTYPLNWTLRYNVTRGVACGIQFLHSIGTKPLIHGDIKSANILLDRNFEAKVGDFGLAREMNPTSPADSYVKVSRVHGTRPYLPDEYLRSKKLSTKVDTFSFGTMLYEVTTGQRVYEESRPKKFLKDIIEETENVEILKDPKGGSENPDIFWILIRLAKSCTQRLAKERPEMVQVLKSLDDLMSQASIRTVSSHVTGLPYLFDQTQSFRPGHSLMPTGTSTNPRLSPIEMRTPSPSPLWVPAQQIQTSTPKHVVESSAASSSSFLRSPLPHSHNPSPITTLSQPASIPEGLDSTNHNSNNGQGQNRHHHQLEIPGGNSPTLPRSFVPLHHPCIQTPAALPPGTGPRLSAILSDDQYFPVILQQSRGDESEEMEEPMTVIPLITELGIKD